MSSINPGVVGSTSSSGAIPVVISGNGTIGSGSKIVTTAGTSVQLSVTSIPCKKVTIQGIKTNSGAIYCGDSTVSSSNGIFVFATQLFQMTVNNLNLVYLDSDNNGEGIHYQYEN